MLSAATMFLFKRFGKRVLMRIQIINALIIQSRWVIEATRESFRNLESHKGECFQVAESETLGISIQKALEKLDWEPRLSCARTVEQVADFFKSQCAVRPERQICLRQIKEYYGNDKGGSGE